MRSKSSVLLACVFSLAGGGLSAAQNPAMAAEPEAVKSAPVLHVLVAGVPELTKPLLTHLNAQLKGFGVTARAANEPPDVLKASEVGLVVLVHKTSAHLRIRSHAGNFERDVQLVGALPNERAAQLAHATAEFLEPNWFDGTLVSTKENGPLASFSLAARGVQELGAGPPARGGAEVELARDLTKFVRLGLHTGVLYWDDVKLSLGTVEAAGRYVGARVGFGLSPTSALRPEVYIAGQLLFLNVGGNASERSSAEALHHPSVTRLNAGFEIGTELVPSLRLLGRVEGGLSLQSIDVSDGRSSAALLQHGFLGVGLGIRWQVP